MAKREEAHKIRKHENEYIKQDGYTVLRIISDKYGTFDFMIDNDDVDRVKKYHWSIFHVHKPKEWTQVFYASTNSKKLLSTHFLLHRYIMQVEKGMAVDHIDGNSLDMRRRNLRICTVEENSMNRGKPYINTSGIKGVCWLKNLSKWKAYIKKNDITYNLGYFDNIDDAAEARKQAEIKFQGKFSRDFRNEAMQN